MRKSLVVGAAVLAVIGTASAATKNWSGGGVNHYWSTPLNWNPMGAPQDGDALVFPSAAIQRHNVNDLTNLRIHSILFSGSGYSVSGNRLRLESNITATHIGSRNYLDCHVEFVDGGGYFATAGNGELEIIGDVILSSNGQLALHCISADIIVSGGILGIGEVIKFGDKSLTFAGNYPNDFSGSLTIRTGTNILAKAWGVTAVPGPLILGSPDEPYSGYVVLHSPHQINDTATNTLNRGSINLNGWDESLGAIQFYDGDIFTGTATLTLLAKVTQKKKHESWVGAFHVSSIRGTIYLPADVNFQVDFSETDDTPISVDANITGPGGVVKDGPGELWVSGTNAFSGLVKINRGLIIVRHYLSLGTGSQMTLDGGNLRLESLNEAASIGSINKHLTITSGGSSLEVSGDWIWGGNVSLNFIGLLYCNAGDGLFLDRLRIFGAIQGSGGIWFGGNAIELLGDNTFTGPTRVACALLSVNNGDGRPFSATQARTAPSPSPSASRRTQTSSCSSAPGTRTCCVTATPSSSSGYRARRRRWRLRVSRCRGKRGFTGARRIRAGQPKRPSDSASGSTMSRKCLP